MRPQLIVMSLCGATAVATATLRYPELDEQLEADLPGDVSGRGFATSNTCRACHPGQYDAWHRSFHRTMTQAATPSTVLGAFDGVSLDTRGFRWRMERRGDEFWVVMPDPVWFENPAWFMQIMDPAWPDAPPQMEARVVMTTGSHHMQNYWVRRPREDAALGADDGSLVQVPWVWLIDERRWVPNQDSFLTPPSGSLGGVARWNANCSQCHSVGTEPHVSESYDRFDTRTAEFGIACEACHGPAEEHVAHYRSPLRRYLRHALLAGGQDPPDPTILNPVKLEQRASLDVCGQCHSFGAWRDQESYRTSGIVFEPGQELDAHRRVFRYADDPEDPELRDMLDADSLALEGRFWRDGTSRIAGREYNAVVASTHFGTSELTCLSCHSMHGYDAPDGQLVPASTGDASCLGCHDEFAGRVAEHTRHRAGSSGSECMNCHMPHTTYGLFSAMRSHRIDSPSVRTSVETGRPNACNLCHLDQTLEWTGRYLSEWFGDPLPELGEDERSIAAAALWALRGDAAQRTIVGWHMGWIPAREASGEEWLAPYLAQLLADPYSATRQVAYRSIVRLPGFQGFRYDYVGAPAELGQKADEAMQRWRGFASGVRPGSAARLLVDERGGVDIDTWLRLLGARDERPLTIRE